MAEEKINSVKYVLKNFCFRRHLLNRYVTFFFELYLSFRFYDLWDVYVRAPTRGAISGLHLAFVDPLVPTFQAYPFWQDFSPKLLSDFGI